MLFHSLFILACFLLDGLIMILFPNSFDPYAMTFVPCLGLSALVLASRHMDKTDSLLMFLMFGMFYDFFVTREYLIYALIYRANLVESYDGIGIRMPASRYFDNFR